MRRFKVIYTVGNGPDSVEYLDFADRVGIPNHGLIKARLFQKLNIQPNLVTVINCREVFDDAMLDRFVNTYYGNGVWNAPYWFLGYENATNPENLIKNVRIWRDLGERTFIDEDPFWGLTGLPNPLLQGRTQYWNAVIRILLSHHFNIVHPNQEMPVAYVNEYKRVFFLNDGKVALLEFFPLPKPRHNDNLYPDLTQLPYLQNDVLYQTQVTPLRANFLNLQITNFHPRTLVCIGMDFFNLNILPNILPGIALVPLALNGINCHQATWVHANGDLTKVVIIPQPVAPGANNNAFFAQLSSATIGQFVDAYLQQLISVLQFMI